MTCACGSLHLSAIFQPVLCWLWCILVPSHHLLWRLRDWMKSSQCQSLFGCTYAFSLFHVVGKSLLGLPRIRLLWGRMCDPYVKESFLTTIPQSCRRDIQPCIVSSVHFAFKIVFVDWQKCGFDLNISIDLSHYLCLRVSHWVVPHWSVTTQFTYEAVIHRVCLSTSTLGGNAFHLPYM